MYQHPDAIHSYAKTLIRVGEQVADYMKQIFDQNNIPQCHIRLTVSTTHNNRGVTFELSETEYFGNVVKGYDPIAVLDEYCRRNNWYQLNKPIRTKLIATNVVDPAPAEEQTDIPF